MHQGDDKYAEYREIDSYLFLPLKLTISQDFFIKTLAKSFKPARLQILDIVNNFQMLY